MPRSFQNFARADSANSVLPKLEAALEQDANDLKAGNDYRQAVIRSGEYDRALKFFSDHFGVQGAIDIANLRGDQDP